MDRGSQSQSSDESSSGYARARTLQTAWNVKIKQLQWEKAAGKLIEKEAVVASLRKFTIYVRDSILAIPDRVAVCVSVPLYNRLILPVSDVLGWRLPVSNILT